MLQATRHKGAIGRIFQVQEPRCALSQPAVEIIEMPSMTSDSPIPALKPPREVKYLDTVDAYDQWAEVAQKIQGP